MKIKDVIAQTDLTDRAIRLYIENGLVSPSVTENYAGRKNIEFSSEDLNTLQNIATLRKADFSIAEIKALTEKPQDSKFVLEDFLNKKKDRIDSDSKIVKALSPLLEEEKFDINIICEKLGTVTAHKELPGEDTKVPLWEKIEKRLFLFLGYGGLACTLIITLANFILIYFVDNFRYPHVEWEFFSTFTLLPIAIFAIPPLYIILYKKHFKKTGRIIRTVISLLLIVPLGFSIFQCGAITLLLHFFGEPLSISQTENPDHYLQVDEHFDEVSSIFPKEIPEKVTYVKYFYRFGTTNGVYGDIVAEWYYPKMPLPYSIYPKEPNHYEEMLNKYKNMKALNGEAPVVKTKGDWVLMYFADSSESNLSRGDYNYIIFAYHPENRTIRLIQSYNRVEPIANFTIPYYLTLDWYS